MVLGVKFLHMFLKILQSYKMAVKNRGVLAAVKLGHTRIFINIKKKENKRNTWYKKCYKKQNGISISDILR
jgi:hypothetical protein